MNLNPLFNYRILPLLKAALNKNELAIKCLINLGQMHEFSVFRQPTKLISFLKSYENTIKYLSWDMQNVWAPFEKMESSHNMPNNILLNYQMSMRELLLKDGLLELDLDFFKQFVTNAVIADIGCGAGQYFELLKALKPKKYIGLDKIEIMIPNLVKLLEDPLFMFVHGEYPNCRLPVEVDTIILAEVLHGKLDKKTFLFECSKDLSDFGHIIVIESNGVNLRHITMSMQMLLHCGFTSNKINEEIDYSDLGYFGYKIGENMYDLICVQSAYLKNDTLRCDVYQRQPTIGN